MIFFETIFNGAVDFDYVYGYSLVTTIVVIMLALGERSLEVKNFERAKSFSFLFAVILAFVFCFRSLPQVFEVQSSNKLQIAAAVILFTVVVLQFVAQVAISAAVFNLCASEEDKEAEKEERARQVAQAEFLRKVRRDRVFRQQIMTEIPHLEEGEYYVNGRGHFTKISD